MHWNGIGNDMLWNDGEEDRGVRGECEEDKGSNCEAVDSDIWGAVVDLDKYICPWQKCFLGRS